MQYIYIFDYTFGHIYEVAVTKKVYENEVKQNIEQYLRKHYNMKAEQISYLCPTNKLQIERIEKIK
ncbi:MAG: hypothetical protein J6M39_06545 [Lachnospiraceae bacterium]|nr:hypothetical protein [Lachnospiraceae bacterium]